MMDTKQIEQWLKRNVITKEQAAEMLKDLAEHKQERTSHGLITVIGTIGSLLLGIGAILFVASNWLVISSFMKTLMLIGSTFAAYATGYVFKYRLRNLPNIGASLLFLGTLLFGATIFLLAQIYHINANNHQLVLLWLMGILPFVYAFTSSSIATLSAWLFFIWMSLFAFRGSELYHVNFMIVPLMFVVSGVLLFNTGALHYFNGRFKKIGRIYRLWGINITMFALFILSFRHSSSYLGGTFWGLAVRPEYIPTQFLHFFIACSFFTSIFALICLWYNPTKSKNTAIETFVSLALVVSSVTCFFLLSVTNIYVLMFNAILAILIALLIVIGYNKEDITVINMGIFWFVACVIARYFDFFWDLFPRSLFFMFGGLILVIGGIILERKRRDLKLVLTGALKNNHTSFVYTRNLFVALAIFWAVLIGGIIVYKEIILRTGYEIILKTVPVDPRDLFRGDYVILRYDISDLDLDTLPSEKTDFNRGDTVFVALEDKDGHAHAVHVGTVPLKGALYLKGKVVSVHGHNISVEYGIESYFVPEHKGEEVERAVGKTVETKVAVNSSGKAVIKSLLMNGEIVSFK